MNKVKDFVTKQVKIRAIQYSVQSSKEVLYWIREFGGKFDYNNFNYEFRLETDEGVKSVKDGDWVIRDVKSGMFSVMNHNKFKHFYENL